MSEGKFITQTAHLFLPSLSASVTFPYMHYKETAAPAKEQSREREVRKIGAKEGEMHRKQGLYLELAVHGGIDKQPP